VPRRVAGGEDDPRAAGQVEVLPIGEPDVDRGRAVLGGDLAQLGALGQRLGQGEARQHGAINATARTIPSLYNEEPVMRRWRCGR
jgi:hypothetical protein